jgi:alcohol dehydrogenase (cytochrome c)/quinohemoprotein ethanol dehydrogenase
MIGPPASARRPVRWVIAGAFAALLLAALIWAILRSISPEDHSDEWPVHGRTERAEGFSPLDQINRETITKLGLAWSLDLETDRGQEATPIMVDGILYTISAYDVVRAIDARTGKLLWLHDPDVREASARSCCGPVSRGVAVANGRVFVGALDGRLIALDAASGRLLWQVQTIDADNPHAENYAITGAPRVVKDKVIIGNGGAEFGVRGYVGAHDVASGRLAWRFYTVPGRPGETDGAASDSAMQLARKSWAGEWWKWGGGGTVWDAIVWDPELDLLYIGTGNGSPWNHGRRSAGRGDNLFLSSIVALRPDTGEYVWHFQQTPADSWDYTATQNIILADLKIAGRTRKVLMQAPKNGFFYILDRATGAFISASAYVDQNWASAIDPVTGRPTVRPEALYYRTGKPYLQRPSSGGGHNWPPMAYSPRTGLVYIPAQDVAIPYAPSDEEIIPGVYSAGVASAGGGRVDPGVIRDMRGYLIAWDPVAGRAAWKRELAAPFNGGVLATGGGLIFQGNAERKLVAYDERDGKALWSFDAGTGIVARPITYSLDGVQYIAVMAGWGGGWPLTGGALALKAGDAIGSNRLLVFRLGGTAYLPPAPARTKVALDPPPFTGPSATADFGDQLYGRFCLRCHGIAAVSAGPYPDLRSTGYLHGAGFKEIVLGGALSSQGMPGFAGKLSERDLEAIRLYLVRRANQDRAADSNRQELQPIRED